MKSKNNIPPLESGKASATDKRGNVRCEDILACPSKFITSLLEDLAKDDWSDKELPKALCKSSFIGL